MLIDVLKEIGEDLQDDNARMEYGEEAAKMDFALALTFARQERNLTQQQLADLLGVSQAYVARLESGEANPTLSKVGRILAALWLRPIDKPFPLLNSPHSPESTDGTAAGDEEPESGSLPTRGITAEVAD